MRLAGPYRTSGRRVLHMTTRVASNASNTARGPAFVISCGLAVPTCCVLRFELIHGLQVMTYFPNILLTWLNKLLRGEQTLAVAFTTTALHVPADAGHPLPLPILTGSVTPSSLMTPLMTLGSWRHSSHLSPRSLSLNRWAGITVVRYSCAGIDRLAGAAPLTELLLCLRPLNYENGHGINCHSPDRSCAPADS
jgi:hypothetical protein